MRRAVMWPGVALLLVLGGCAGERAEKRAGVPEVCARQADADPTVRQLLAMGAGNPRFLRQNEAKMRAARQDATVACLRDRGLAPKGGVERPVEQ